MLLDTTISIFKIDDNYVETPLYTNIRANLQSRLYNIKDVLTNVAEREVNDSYYVIVNKQFNQIRTWDLIRYTDDFWIAKELKITTFGMEKFKSKDKFIEIKAQEFTNAW